MGLQLPVVLLCDVRIFQNPRLSQKTQLRCLTSLILLVFMTAVGCSQLLTTLAF